tara:strand:+ start:89 stop:835 length:747 start_codon:yes stop_codon:yes gene_type:complete
MLAIIGGSGMTQLSCLEVSHRQVMRTPYGEPSGPFTFGKINNHEIVFLSRHGHGRIIPPHMVNYRANIWALHSLKPEHIIAVAAVGGIRADFRPGIMAVPEQIIDYTHSRQFTYFEGNEQSARYVDFSEPYCQVTRNCLLEAAQKANESVIDGGIYAAMQGPRLETIAEINRLERDGADMVGMTGMPEAALARELDLRYATIAVVANYAAGRSSNTQAKELEAVYSILEQGMIGIRNILEQLVKDNGD